MDAGQLVSFRGLRNHRNQTIGQHIGTVDHRAETGRAFGMSRTDHVIEIGLVRGEQDRHRRRRYRSDVITGLRQRRRNGLPRLLDDGSVRARVRHWPQHPEIVQLILTDHTTGPTTSSLSAWLSILASSGATMVRTGALSESATSPFLSLGFERIQVLSLLEMTIDRNPMTMAPLHSLRSIRGPRQIALAARIDTAAFDPGWELDSQGIVDACEATPQHRIRLAVTAADEPAGYVITGRNGTAGFVQRLAVLPRFEGQGVASSLLSDGLSWLQRRGARTVLVNTDVANVRARRLYERFGFVLLEETLHVLERRLTTDLRS